MSLMLLSPFSPKSDFEFELPKLLPHPGAAYKEKLSNISKKEHPEGTL